MSGLLGSVLSQVGSVFSGVQASSAGAMIDSVLQSSGGVQGLVAKFQAAGLGEHAASWVGTGSNIQVTAEQITKVFPPAQIEAFAEQHGVPAGIAAQLLAHLLPQAVDAATPGGVVPSAAA
jgi:uncharacterized protein YidB (DUF937 family)